MNKAMFLSNYIETISNIENNLLHFTIRVTYIIITLIIIVLSIKLIHYTVQIIRHFFRFLLLFVKASLLFSLFIFWSAPSKISNSLLSNFVNAGVKMMMMLLLLLLLLFFQSFFVRWLTSYSPSEYPRSRFEL